MSVRLYEAPPPPLPRLHRLPHPPGMGGGDKGEKMKIGDRVCSRYGGVGIVEAVDDNQEWPNADVRWLTPDNKPSCCISLCPQKHLIVVGDNVLPQPRSQEWKAQSKEFCTAIENILKEHFGKEAL